MVKGSAAAQVVAAMLAGVAALVLTVSPAGAVDDYPTPPVTVDPQGAVSPVAEPASAPGALPRTGSESLPLLRLAVVLIAVGGVVVYVVRHRGHRVAAS